LIKHTVRYGLCLRSGVNIDRGLAKFMSMEEVNIQLKWLFGTAI